MATYDNKLKDSIAELQKQKAILEASAEHTKRYGFEVKKNQDRVVEFNKKLEKLKKLQEEIYGIEEDKASLGKEINNITKKYGDQLLKQLKLDSSIDVMKQAHNTKDKDLLKSSKDYARVLDKVLSGEMDSVDLLKERKNFSGEYLEAIKELAEVLENTPELAGKFRAEAKVQQQIEQFRNKVQDISDVLSSPKAMGAAVLGYVGKQMFDFANDANEARMSLGASAGEALNLAGNMKVASVASAAVGGNTQEAKAAVTSMVEEFGSLGVVTNEVAMGLGRVTGQFGLSGANAGKLLKSMEAISGASIETNINLIESVGSLARAEGVAPAQVLNDIAENTETFAQFAKGGGENLAKAAIQARKLGLNLGTVAGIAEKLLDFESSIESSMEASVLLGRQVNTDKARELALTGDLEGLAKEVKNQVGSQAEFEAMNVVQRKALAEAMGVTVSDLGKIVAGEKTSAVLAEERAGKEAKMLDLQNLALKVASGHHAIEVAILAVKGLQAAKNSKLMAGAVSRLAPAGMLFGLSTRS